jgi:hypothetical protein
MFFSYSKVVEHKAMTGHGEYESYNEESAA